MEVKYMQNEYHCRQRAIIYTKSENHHKVILRRFEAKQSVGRMKKTETAEQNRFDNMIVARNLVPITSDFATQLSFPSRSAINLSLNRQKVKENRKQTHILVIWAFRHNFKNSVCLTPVKQKTSQY